MAASSTSSQHSKRVWGPPLMLGLVLGLLVVAVFGRCLSYGFVYDSQAQVLNDGFIHQPANWAKVLTLRVLGGDVLDFNRPANLASLMVDAWVWGKNPFGYHLTNLLLHLANSLMLYALLLKLDPIHGSYRTYGSHGVAALFFALHPLMVETVVEVSYREDLLVAFFSLAGVLLFLSGTAATPAVSARRPYRVAAGVILCLFLAAASKETGIMTPLWLAGMMFALEKAPLRGRPSPLGEQVFLLGGALLAVGGFAFARFAFEPAHSVIFPSKPQQLGGSLAETLLVQVRIWAFYFRQILFPVDLCAVYGPYSIRNFEFGPSLLVVGGVLVMQGLLSWRSRLAGLGMLTFWIFLLPVSNLLPMFCPMADRFLYFPMIGVALMLAGILAQMPVHGKSMRGVVAALAALGVLGVLAVQSHAQTGIWRESITLWRATLKTNPASIEALNNLAGALVDAGKPREALEELGNARLALRHAGAETFAVKAVALDTLGERAQADAAFRRAVEIDAKYAQPSQLVQGLTWNRQQANKLQIIADRN